MNLNLEIFYGEDENKKMNHIQSLFQEIYQKVQLGENISFGNMNFKTLVRVLTDDYKKSPDLTLVTLKLIHIILSHSSREDRVHIVDESPVEVFMVTASKIFGWESRRSGRIFGRFRDLFKSGNNSIELGSKDRTNKRTQGSSLNSLEYFGKENKSNASRDESKEFGSSVNGSLNSKLARNDKVVRTMNINLMKQSRTMAMMVMILREYFSIMSEPEINKETDFKNYFVNIGITQHLVRCLDHEDSILLKVVILLLTDIVDSRIADDLLSKKLLPRLVRLINSKDCPYVASFCRELLKWPISTTIDPTSFLEEVIKGFEKGNISQSLTILNILSYDPRMREMIINLDIHVYLLGIAITCFKQDDKGDGKRPMWNLLINLSISPVFVDKVLRFQSFGLFFDFFLRTKSIPCLRLLDNLLWFCQSPDLKTKYYGYSESFVELLEQTGEPEHLLLSGVVNVLSEIYSGKERKPITLMMKLLKRGNPHPMLFLSVFNFLNKSLYALPHSNELVSASVSDYALKHFFKPQPGIEPEIQTQFLIFISNLMITKGSSVDMLSLTAYIDNIEIVSLRLGTLVLNLFDIYLLISKLSNENTQSIISRKREFFSRFLQKMNQTSYVQESEC